MPELRKKKRGTEGTEREFAAMPMQRVIDYLTRPDELLPTWQALLLGLLKVVLLVSVTTTIQMLVKEEVKASFFKTTAEIKLIQQAEAVFPTADGLTQKRLLSYELSVCDTVSDVSVEFEFDEGTELHEYNVTYSDGTEGGFEHRLLGQNRISFALQRDVKKNRTARIDLLISGPASGRNEASEPGKSPDIHVTGKDKHGDVRFILGSSLK